TTPSSGLRRRAAGSRPDGRPRRPARGASTPSARRPASATLDFLSNYCPAKESEVRKLLVLASLLATAVAPGASAGPVKGAPVSAGGPGVQSGYECAVSGVSFLIRNNLLLAVARNGL